MNMGSPLDRSLGLARAAHDAFRLYLQLAMQSCVPAQRWVALMSDIGQG